MSRLSCTPSGGASTAGNGSTVQGIFFGEWLFFFFISVLVPFIWTLGREKSLLPASFFSGAETFLISYILCLGKDLSGSFCFRLTLFKISVSSSSAGMLFPSMIAYNSSSKCFGFLDLIIALFPTFSFFGQLLLQTRQVEFLLENICLLFQLFGRVFHLTLYATKMGGIYFSSRTIDGVVGLVYVYAFTI